MLCLASAALWLTCAFGGSVKSWKFGDADYVYPPSAMVFLGGIKEAVIFGNTGETALDSYAYVTTLKESNELSDYTTLEGVLEINNAVAHSTDDNIVLVAGVAESGGDIVTNTAFVGALRVYGANNYNWEMFSLLDAIPRMSCVEVFPDSNMFVAVGNSDGAGEGNGMIFAAYDLDDFSQLYAMQHTSYYSQTAFWTLGEALLRGMARLGSDDFVVVNTGDVAQNVFGLCRFKVARDTLHLHWCRRFNSDNSVIAGVHVTDNSSILVTGHRDYDGKYVPFVRHFEAVRGHFAACHLWKYNLTHSQFAFVGILTSLYDAANDVLYMGGQYYDYGPPNPFHVPKSLVLVYNVSGQHLEDALEWRGIFNTHRAKAVYGIVKSDNGTLMFANDPNSKYKPEISALVTATDLDCFSSNLSKYIPIVDASNYNVAADSVYFGNYSVANATLGENLLREHQSAESAILCRNGSSVPLPFSTTAESDGNGDGNGGANVGAIVGAVLGGVCGCLLFSAFIVWYRNEATKSTTKEVTVSEPMAATSAQESELGELEMREAEAKRKRFDALAEIEAKEMRQVTANGTAIAVAPPQLAECSTMPPVAVALATSVVMAATAPMSESSAEETTDVHYTAIVPATTDASPAYEPATGHSEDAPPAYVP